MKDIVVLDKEVEIFVANGQVMIARKNGTVEGICQGKYLQISALIVEGVKHNLISVSQLIKKGHTVTFQTEKVKIIGQNFELNCKNQNNLFIH